ncbi:MAG: NDP-sugar synthase [bacterium]
MKHITSAVLLAAGFGTRLRPLTQRQAKPSLPFFDRTVIHHLIEKLIDIGIKQLFINLHYRAGSIRRALRLDRFRSLEIHFSFEPTILGTAGALFPLRRYLQGEPFFLINGDIVTDIDLRDVIDSHRHHENAIATIVLHPSSAHYGYPQIGASSDFWLTRFPYGVLRDGDYDWSGTFAGIHILEPEFLKFIDRKAFMCINSEIYPRILELGHRVGVYRHDGYWSDIGTIKSYYRAHFHVLQGLLKLPGVSDPPMDHWAHPTSQVDSGTRMGSNVVLCPGCTIGREVVLENIVVWPGIHIPDGSCYKNGILVDSKTFISITDES